MHSVVRPQPPFIYKLTHPPHLTNYQVTGMFPCGTANDHFSMLLVLHISHVGRAEQTEFMAESHKPTPTRAPSTIYIHIHTLHKEMYY